MKKINRELSNLTSKIKYFKDNDLYIGLPKDAVTISKDNSETSVVEYAIRHEYGIGVPMRSWLREPIAIHKKEVMKLAQQEIAKALRGNNSPEKAYSRIGTWVSQFLKTMFDTGGEGRWKLLSPTTIAKKGFDTILVETGNLRRMITYVIRKN